MSEIKPKKKKRERETELTAEVRLALNRACTLLILILPPSDSSVATHISACLANISSQMSAHYLKINPNNTEMIFSCNWKPTF